MVFRLNYVHRWLAGLYPRLGRRDFNVEEETGSHQCKVFLCT
jgi:hypothetical protein